VVVRRGRFDIVKWAGIADVPEHASFTRAIRDYEDDYDHDYDHGFLDGN
jgi:hypothetical protein